MPDTNASGWYADLEDADTRDARHPWQPHIQVAGANLSLSVWFKTEDECIKYIREQIAGKGMLDE